MPWEGGGRRTEESLQLSCTPCFCEYPGLSFFGPISGRTSYLRMISLPLNHYWKQNETKGRWGKETKACFTGKYPLPPTKQLLSQLLMKCFFSCVLEEWGSCEGPCKDVGEEEELFL